jgi:DNA-binding beta-propeller fold protein YncE
MFWLASACLVASTSPATEPFFTLPSGNRYAEVAPGKKTILPNGRVVTPAGKRLWCHEGLWHASLSPEENTVVTICVGDAYRESVKPQMVVFQQVRSVRPVRRVIHLKAVAPAGFFTPDGSRYIVSIGDDGGLASYFTRDWKLEKTVLLARYGRRDSYLNDFAISKDGTAIYAADIARQQIHVIHPKTFKPIRTIQAGRQPYALTVSEDGRKLFVANIGIFNYSPIPKPGPDSPNSGGLNGPPFAYPSKESVHGVRKEGRNVPGLGRPTTLDAQSVWSYSLVQPSRPKLLSKAKSGSPIRSVAEGKTIGGSAPNALLADRGELFVSNANNDTISVLNQETLGLKRTIRVSPIPELSQYRGIIPTSLAMSPNGKTLYVCESGLNAVAVIDRRSGRITGHIPAAFWPLKVLVGPSSRALYIANQRGLGQGPLGPKHPRPRSDERFGLTERPGLLQRLTMPDRTQLASMTKTVLGNNGLLASKRQAMFFDHRKGFASDKIKHVVFITKENHTFDGIFGTMKGARAEPSYAEFGEQGWVRERSKTQRRSIMPNHLKLAREFAISDNFYMEPYASGDGHRWLVGNYNSLWSNRVFFAGWQMRPTAHAKGRYPSFGAYGSQIPEDYLENGAMWEHLDRNGITFRNYGEGYELPGGDQGEPKSRTGQTYRLNMPVPLALHKNTDYDFPAYNTNIPDIARADWFIEDLEEYRAKHSGKIPQFINIAICNDHGDKPRPNRGYPFTSSYMADNDLALGRIVEYLTRLPQWESMAIFVTQDDPGGDNDGVDRFRSFILCISPYARRGYISHRHTSITSMIRTLYMAFGLGPNNLYDAVASPLDDMLGPRFDPKPYQHVVPDRRVFRAEDTFDPTDPKFERRRREASVPMDDPKFVRQLRERG